MKSNFKIFSCALIITVVATLYSCKKDFLGQVPDENINISDVFELKVYT
jgi:hypothetical protein